MKSARFYWFAGIAFAAGCTAIGSSQYAERFGTPEPRERVVERLPAGDVDYWRDIVSDYLSDKPDKVAKSIQKGVAKAFKHYPPDGD